MVGSRERAGAAVQEVIEIENDEEALARLRWEGLPVSQSLSAFRQKLRALITERGGDPEWERGRIASMVHALRAEGEERARKGLSISKDGSWIDYLDMIEVEPGIAACTVPPFDITPKIVCRYLSIRRYVALFPEEWRRVRRLEEGAVRRMEEWLETAGESLPDESTWGWREGAGDPEMGA